MQSQPARAVWIEICNPRCNGSSCPGHSLRGLCGLKLSITGHIQVLAESQPARAVWIEIILSHDQGKVNKSHSLRGLCGLKSVEPEKPTPGYSHSLRGLCGLKLP